MAGPSDIRLPRLRSTLKLFRNPQSSTSGEPTWSLHDPISNSYYRLNWPEFECLARFSRAKNVADLLDMLRNETTLSVDENDIAQLIHFLQKNGLVVLADQGQASAPAKDKKIWQHLINNYLYFSWPLCQPDAFLKRTLPMALPLLSRQFFYLMLTLFAIAAVMTLSRWDDFTHTFTELFSVEGAVLVALTFAFVKIIHELGHAYTAVRNSVTVPHLGVAFIVMYPVLYTETTGAWQLPSHQARREIALAGIRAEICLSALALALWHVVPDGGTLQSLCFLVVTVALVSSLLVNLNPFMRFDGYYILSDSMGLENLQSRSCNFARWKLRHFLFGLTDEPPESLPPTTQRFMTIFGFTLLIYRFFLFSGIAFLVYHLFFQPLGVILFLVEISVFIALPILGEVSQWWKQRNEIWGQKRARISIIGACAICLLFLSPINREITVYGVIAAEENFAVYAPAPAYITAVRVKNGDIVHKGDVLIEMVSPELERDYALAINELERQNAILRRSTDTLSGDTLNQLAAATDNTVALKKQITDIEAKQKQLVLTAPFDGTIRDMPSAINADIFVGETTLIMRLINPVRAVATAYATENQLHHLSIGQHGTFRSAGNPFSSIPLSITHISQTNSDSLESPLLASIHGGPIAVEQSPAQPQKMIPRQSLYQVRLSVIDSSDSELSMSQRGVICITGSWHSPLMNIWDTLSDKFMRK